MIRGEAAHGVSGRNQAALAQALAHRAAATARLSLLLAGRIAVLREAIRRSQALGPDAAALHARLGACERESDGRELSGARYLALCRELQALEGALCAAEARREAAERRGRLALYQALGYLGEVAPELRRLIERAGVLHELPLDPGLGERVPAWLALLRARAEAVPRLAAARPAWKKER